jgi:hypothetical protein
MYSDRYYRCSGGTASIFREEMVKNIFREDGSSRFLQNTVKNLPHVTSHPRRQQIFIVSVVQT